MANATLGRPGAWIRDLAIVGAGTAFLSLFAIDFAIDGVRSSHLVAAGSGALVGAAFGWCFRRLLLRGLHLPLLAWLPISLALGALWGGAVGAISAVIVGPRDIVIPAGFGAITGALQLSWFWLPYAVRAGRGKSTWPVVTTAIVLGGAIGYAALYLLLIIWRPALD